MSAKDRQTLLVNLEIMIAQQKVDYDRKREALILMIKERLARKG